MKANQTSPKISLPIYYIDHEAPGPLSCIREKKDSLRTYFVFSISQLIISEFQLHKLHGERINIPSTHIVYQQSKMKPEVNYLHLMVHHQVALASNIKCQSTH